MYNCCYVFLLYFHLVFYYVFLLCFHLVFFTCLIMFSFRIFIVRSYKSFHIYHVIILCFIFVGLRPEPIQTHLALSRPFICCFVEPNVVAQQDSMDLLPNRPARPGELGPWPAIPMLAQTLASPTQWPFLSFASSHKPQIGPKIQLKRDPNRPSQSLATVPPPRTRPVAYVGIPCKGSNPRTAAFFSNGFSANLQLDKTCMVRPSHAQSLPFPSAWRLHSLFPSMQNRPATP